MDDLTSTRLFSLLTESSEELSNKEMQNAYGQFVVHMEAISSSDDYTSIFRTLNLTRIEMAHLETVYRYEKGEKCPKKSLPAQSVIIG